LLKKVKDIASYVKVKPDVDVPSPGTLRDAEKPKDFAPKNGSLDLQLTTDPGFGPVKPDKSPAAPKFGGPVCNHTPQRDPGYQSCQGGP
jgi:hypothetical protein